MARMLLFREAIWIAASRPTNCGSFQNDRMCSSAITPPITRSSPTTRCLRWGADRRAQETIASITGVRPIAVAYPNGEHSPQIERCCMDAGLTCGFTVVPRKIKLPLQPDSPEAMRLGRFTPDSEQPIARQCKTYRSDFQIYATFYIGYKRIAHTETKARCNRKGLPNLPDINCGIAGLDLNRRARPIDLPRAGTSGLGLAVNSKRSS